MLILLSPALRLLLPRGLGAGRNGRLGGRGCGRSRHLRRDRLEHGCGARLSGDLLSGAQFRTTVKARVLAPRGPFAVGATRAVTAEDGGHVPLAVGRGTGEGVRARAVEFEPPARTVRFGELPHFLVLVLFGGRDARGEGGK